MIRRLCIIGVGLIGGSLARALRKAKVCDYVVGAGRNPDNLRKGVELGVIDHYELDTARAVEGADVVVVAVPLGAMEAVFKAISDGLEPDAVITDVGSAKRIVTTAARSAFGAVPRNLVPGHPIAGTEKSGVTASFESLFRNRQVILTPDSETSPIAVERVRRMWEATGATVVEMDADHHDEVLAATSHLPHILAYSLVDMLGRTEGQNEIFRYAAGGFRDFTRIASSDPQMWHDIFIANGEAILGVLESFERELGTIIAAIRAGDGETIKDVLVRAKTLRDRYAANSGGENEG